MVISILAPYGERLIKQLILKFQFPQFQFTSPYRERRNNIHHDFDQKAVSILAPMRERRKWLHYQTEDKYISIHAPL